MTIRILNNETEVLSHKNDYENGSFAYSMNRYHIRSEIVPEILIVGTITPPGNKGYYYTSLRRGRGNRGKNNVYSYLNSAYEGKFDCNFIERIMDADMLPIEDMSANSLENSIIYNRNKDLITEIIEKLESKNICFFDVFSCVLRRNPNSYRDSDIAYASLDNESFCRVFSTEKDLENCKIIVNSEEALKHLLDIINKCFPEYSGKIYCVPQLPNRLTKRVKDNKGLDESTKLKEIWKNFLENDFDGVNDNFKQFVIKDDYKNREWPYKIKQHNSD